MKYLALVISLIATAWAVPIYAQMPAINLRGVDEALIVEPTQVMVLGTAHLAAFDNVEPRHIDSLLDRLAVYNPQAITIEGVPGETCEMMRAYPSEYAAALDSYCTDVAPFRAESAMNAAEAAARVRALLGDWPSTPAPAERRSLAAAFLAAGEPYSALVQWWQLDQAERRSGDGLGMASVAYLENRATSMNESTQIAARLAARLGLERVFTADDHSSDLVLKPHGLALWARMREIWDTNDPSSKDGYVQAENDIVAGDILAAYRFYNSPETQRQAINNDFRKAMNDSEGAQFGRAYNSWYQVRNLRMVSNVVAAGATVPGGRVLSVVGASHKPYFEAYLDMMHDIELISTDTILN
ncbi:DUF5694 domain-containing protein [Parasphingorhabdus cellanae]|uniref:TraB/GumN family protein n=1 Tax=Parasphingorhabdus cellanae TaxID=2806553 RepID=A0ABX7T7N0_9SPHN|nr:DUF5694 domain-containing protein [Parasphingorhabdus cellanae]QTD56507.1 hypothetical protein J4G78_02610 [Parasphingorhabdus cellanae]